MYNMEVTLCSGCLEPVTAVEVATEEVTLYSNIVGDVTRWSVWHNKECFCPSCGVPGCADTMYCAASSTVAWASFRGVCYFGHSLAGKDINVFTVEPDGPALCSNCDHL